ncbi:MAG: hypothetical protein ACM3PY_15285 [Omnitrophica WOR_2 bacterium]
MHWVNWTIRRPLEFTAYKFILTIFGVNIPVLYAINVFILFLSSFLLYWIIQELLPDHRYLAFATGLIYLFYPADYTRMWLMMISHHLAWMLILISFVLLIDFARNGHIISLLCALLLFTITLGEYEGQLGVMVAFCFLLVAIYWRIPWKRRLALLSPLLVAGLFVIWRMIVQPALKVYDPYVSEFALSPEIFAQKIAMGFRVLLLSWTEPYLLFLNFPHKNIILFIIFGVAVILFGMAAYVVYRLIGIKNLDSLTSITGKYKKEEIKMDLYLLLAGCALLVAGYLPVITIYQPSLYEVSTRVNFYAIPGAALMAAALLNLGAVLLANYAEQLRAMVLAGAVPLLLVGMTTQMMVQNASRQVWDGQKELWTQLFEIVPNAPDRTIVIFVLPGYKHLGFAQTPPFVASWEVNWGLQVLYNNPYLFGGYDYPDINVGGEVKMLPEGVLIESLETPIPYSKIIFVQYDPGIRRLKLMTRIEETLNLPFSVQGYNPIQNLLSAKANTLQYRYMVGR